MAKATGIKNPKVIAVIIGLLLIIGAAYVAMVTGVIGIPVGAVGTIGAVLTALGGYGLLTEK
jgi:hypothetical protein